MKSRNLFLLLLSAAMTFLPSCGKSGANSSTNDSTSTDTTVKQPAPSVTMMLPDTVYPSVSLIKSRTTIIDTTTNGTLSCTNNLYANVPGIFTFRGGALRDANYGGKVSGNPSKITIDWQFTTNPPKSSKTAGRWGGGSGWTGQPLYIQWPDSCVAKFKSCGVVGADFNPQEIIVGSLAGEVYFIDFQSGRASRKPVTVTNPIKGTVSLDPALNGNLYVGHGIPAIRPFGAVMIDLYKGEVVDVRGEDSKAPRHWGAYDSSALRVGQFLFRPGENGVIYKYSVKPGGIKIHSTMSYTAPSSLGMEASMSAYLNYGFTADNGGLLVCTNLNTMRPVWAYNLGDDTDSSPMLIIEDGHPYLYIGTEIDKQGQGEAKMAKIDALNGKAVWTTMFEGKMAKVGDKHFDGGFYATILPGRGNCSDLLFCNMVRNLKGQNGEFVAVEKATGKVRYTTPLKYYAWSSPVGLLNEKDEQFVVTGDCTGRIYLINGADGKIIASEMVGNNFESSPAVIGNKIVVGSRGDKIYKISID